MCSCFIQKNGFHLSLNNLYHFVSNHLKLSFFEVPRRSSQPVSPWHQSFSAEAQTRVRPESGWWCSATCSQWPGRKARAWRPPRPRPPPPLSNPSPLWSICSHRQTPNKVRLNEEQFQNCRHIEPAMVSIMRVIQGCVVILHCCDSHLIPRAVCVDRGADQRRAESKA